MLDLKTKIERLIADADDCELISRLATDVSKRASFRRLAEQYRKMAKQLQDDLDPYRKHKP